MDDGSPYRLFFDTYPSEIPLLWNDVSFAYDRFCGWNHEYFVLTLLDLEETYSVAIRGSVAQA